MNIPKEYQKDFDSFPPVLRALLDAEIAAGNALVEIGHGFPAPPVGAYIKLAQPITTRTRASGDGIVFYDRNSSIYSGEFTDAKRFFFILEPPHPPPPEPDMDAIRQSYEPKPDSLTRRAQRPAGASGEIAAGDSSSSPTSAEARERRREGSAEKPAPARKALTSIETATGAKRLLHFQDKRPPHEVQFALEREFRTLFTAAMDDGRLIMSAKTNVIGAHYCFELRFEAALILKNCYSLRIEVSWAEQAATHHDYYRKTSDSRFSLWTRDLMAANPPGEGEGSADRYRKLSEAALKAEAHLDSVAAIQQAIVAGIKHGGSYGTSHKEGGTNIFWRNGEFVRSDYGDYPDLKRFTDEAEFLKMLRQFCQWDVTHDAGTEQHSDFDVWKLILRRLHPK